MTRVIDSVADPEDRAMTGGGEGGLGAVPPAGVQGTEPAPLEGWKSKSQEAGVLMNSV